jgi:hypothetical protein
MKSSRTESAPRRSQSPKRGRRPLTPPSDALDSEEELFDDRRPAKRSRLDRAHERGVGSVAGLNIWEIMNPGRSKAAYLSRDIDSDEDDMEAGMDDLEREEAMRFVNRMLCVYESC